jgi:uncharacterized membrane protein YbhN (UPF0104 family)
MRRTVRSVLAASAAAFLALALVKGYHRLPKQTLHVRPAFVALAVVVGAAGVIITAAVWWILIRRPHVDLSLFEAIQIFSLSQATKYIPGAIWQPVSWIVMTREAGVTATMAGATIVTLLALDVASGFVVGPVLLAVSGASARFDWFLLLVPPSLVLVHPAVMSRAVRLGARILRREATDVSLASTRRTFVALVAILPVWFAFGGSVFLAGQAVHIGTAADWALITGAFAVAWGVGFLALPVPSGLGVREAMFVLIVRSVMSTPKAVLLAVASRLVFTLTEAIMAVIALITRRRTRARVTEPERG